MANSTDGKLFESVLFVKMAITNISTVFLTIIILLTFFTCAENARILGVFPLSGKSLNILYNKLMKGLADAGHDVTVVSAYQNQLPLINGTYKDVVLTGFADDYESELLSSYYIRTMLWSFFLFSVFGRTEIRQS